MPEGDTLAKTAARLAPALEGATLDRFEAPRLVGRPPRAGARIERVEARGKHLLVLFAGGLTLRTHLRMTGSWHLYRRGQRWRRPAHQARVVLGTAAGWVAVCFAAPVVETYDRRGPEPAALAALGPDLSAVGSLDPAVLRTVVERVAALAQPGTTVGEALLDQRIAAGIGNVYKSEVCFACGVDPSTRIEAVPEADRHRLWATAARQLQANLGSAGRRTWGDGLAVYARRGLPCPRCSSPVRMTRQGALARSTYWCARCQVRPTVPTVPTGSGPAA